MYVAFQYKLGSSIALCVSAFLGAKTRIINVATGVVREEEIRHCGMGAKCGFHILSSLGCVCVCFQEEGTIVYCVKS